MLTTNSYLYTVFLLMVMIHYHYYGVNSFPQMTRRIKMFRSQNAPSWRSDIRKATPTLIVRQLSTVDLVTDPAVRILFSWLGPICFIGLQLSSVSTAMKIIERKSVGKFSPIPFASLFTNCWIWALYGFLKADSTILLPNCLGVVSSIFCLWAYHTNSVKKPSIEYIVIAIISGLCILLANLQQVQWIGLIGCFLSVLLSGSPLAVVRTVIKEKSTAALPFFTSLVTWVNNFSWICYGYLIVGDPLIYLPNLLGFFLSSIQMLLLFRYPNSQKVNLPDSNET